MPQMELEFSGAEVSITLAPEDSMSQERKHVAGLEKQAIRDQDPRFPPSRSGEKESVLDSRLLCRGSTLDKRCP